MIDLLLRNGLLQFGLFDDVPFKLNLDLLPSYPQVLRELVAGMMPLVDIGQYERLLCAPDAVPLGVLISQQAGIPLVYSLGSERPAAFDLVGAYDVGHPTLLVANQWPVAGNLPMKAERVGLRVGSVLTVVDYGWADDLHVHALLRLPDVIAALEDTGRIPPGQADAVRRWLQAR